MTTPEAGIQIVIDAEQLERAIKKAPQQLKRSWGLAAKEAAHRIINTKGLRNYPSQKPPKNPMRGYTRGKGSYYVRKDGSKKQYYNSERAGTQWRIRAGQAKDVRVVISNRASYAPFLYGTKGKTGDKGQSEEMERRGWRQLWDVAQEKKNEVRAIFEKWTAYALRKVGLL